jgi:cell division GTPase FtsZ
VSEARSLDLCAIGLGQAGGWLAAEWRRRGYRALVLNTAKSDLRGLLGKQPGLEVPEKDQLYIAIEGADGAGRDPSWGKRCVREHEGAIRAAVQRQLNGADAILLMAGLGGGTGSAVDELIKVLEPLEIPLVVLATLPSDGESGIAKVNAVRAVDAITRLPVAGRFFVDNGRLLESFPGVDVISYFQKVNARVLGPLDELNRLNVRDDTWSIKTFDGEDLRKVLLSSGALLIHTARLKEGVLASADLVDAAVKCIDGGEFLAKGTDEKKVAYLSVVVAGPEKSLKATPMQVFEEAAAELKQRTGGGAFFDGLYVTPDDQPLRVWVLASSLSMPKRVLALVERATIEGTELAKKIAIDLSGLDTSALAGLTLFRGPRGAGSLPPIPAFDVGTSLPPMPASALSTIPPSSAPVAQLASAQLPNTMAGPVGTLPALRKPIAVTEVLPGGSNLPSLPANAVLPAPDALASRAVPEELTMEGDSPASPALPSLPPGPQAEAEELVARYREGDRRAKERIGKKLLEDSRSPDTQVRMSAVWSMVQLQDVAFRRALTRCSNDENKEIAKLAISGLDALGDVPSVE